jgi:hypothetical protein
MSVLGAVGVCCSRRGSGKVCHNRDVPANDSDSAAASDEVWHHNAFDFERPFLPRSIMRGGLAFDHAEGAAPFAGDIDNRFDRECRVEPLTSVLPSVRNIAAVSRCASSQR